MYEVGSYVRKQRNPGMAGIIVGGPIDDCDEIYWSVRQPNGRLQNWLEDAIELVPTLDSIEDLLRKGAFGTKADFSRLVTFHRLNQPLSDNIYALHTTKTDFYPYQFKPLLKFLDSPNQRMLIADEVGLGKTIEAGLIFTELRARTRLQRALVICPSPLCQKWQWEMYNRFSEDFQVLDKKGFLQFLDRYEENQGQVPLRAICSMQGIRSRDILDRLEELDPVFDLVVIDEAHHMRNRTTLTHDLGLIMSRASEAFLMLTATPVQTSHENLFNLLSVLDEEQFNDGSIFIEQLTVNQHILRAEAALSSVPINVELCRESFGVIQNLPDWHKRWFVNNPMWDIANKQLAAVDLESKESIVDLRRSVSELNLLGASLSRTRKREVIENAPVRKPKSLKVTFTDLERHFYEKITDYIRSQYASCDGSFEKFILMMPQRLAASCIPATIEHYFGSDVEESLGLDYMGSLGDEGVDVSNGTEEMGTSVASVISDFKHGIEHDSKYEALIEYLSELDNRDKILLFSTFPGTLKYLSSRLQQDGVNTRTIHGGIKVADRAQSVEYFRDNIDCRVLLTSEVGGEGLDFQFCCVLVNYDLPWNPMVVEQRIGRLDRLGQQSESIRIVNFSVEGTIDSVILDRLYMRIGIFERTIGLTDGILGNIVYEISDVLMSQNLTDEDRSRQIEMEALAVVQKLQMQNNLQEGAGDLLVADQFLDDEVRKANELHRYVSGEEVKTLVMEYIGKYFPATRYDADRDNFLTYTLWPDENLKGEIRNFNRQPGDRLPYALLHDRGSKVTFDVQVAEKYSGIEYIHIHHPLVRIIMSHYQKHLKDFSPTASMNVVMPEIPSGDYVFVINKLMMTGIRQNIRLIATYCNLKTFECLEPDSCERLFSAMVSKGSDFTTGKRFSDTDRIVDAYQSAKEEFSRMSRRIITLAKDRDQAFRSRRESSITAYFEKRIRRQHELANKHRLKRSQPTVIKGFETRAENLDQEMVATLETKVRGNPFETSKEELIAGVVRVQ